MDGVYFTLDVQAREHVGWIQLRRLQSTDDASQTDIARLSKRLFTYHRIIGGSRVDPVSGDRHLSP